VFGIQAWYSDPWNAAILQRFGELKSEAELIDNRISTLLRQNSKKKFFTKIDKFANVARGYVK
jgi:hypothetical protein